MTIVAELLIFATAAAAAVFAAVAISGRFRASTELVVKRRESPVEYFLRTQREAARSWQDVDR